MGYSGAGGKLIHEKNLKSKISWHCPFKFAFHFCSTTHWKLRFSKCIFFIQPIICADYAGSARLPAFQEPELRPSKADIAQTRGEDKDAIEKARENERLPCLI